MGESRIAGLAKTHGRTVAKMRAAGATYREVAAALGWSFHSARNVAILMGATARADGRVADHGAAEAVEVVETRDGRTVSMKSDTVRTVDGLLVAASVDRAKWAVVEAKVNKWDSSSVDRTTGDVRVVELWQVKARLEPVVGSELERCPPVPLVDIEPRAAGLPGAADETWVLIPDSHHGFGWNEKFTALEPSHDMAAIDVVRQLCELLQPDGIGFLGDHFDGAGFSRFRQSPRERNTSQPALCALAWDLAEFRRVCPRARMVYTGGNHDERPEYRINEVMPELAATRSPWDQHHPYSMRSLLRLDAHYIEYVPYKDSWWLWDDVEVTHEDGLDLMKSLGKRQHSLIQGHTHKLLFAQRTLWGPTGSRVIHACSPGTLARIAPGVVPGAVPRNDWQQGVAVAQRVNGKTHMQVLPIVDGCLTWGGSVLSGRDRSDEVALFSGYPQMGFRHG